MTPELRSDIAQMLGFASGWLSDTTQLNGLTFATLLAAAKKGYAAGLKDARPDRFQAAITSRDAGFVAYVNLPSSVITTGWIPPEPFIVDRVDLMRMGPTPAPPGVVSVLRLKAQG